MICIDMLCKKQKQKALLYHMKRLVAACCNPRFSWKQKPRLSHRQVAQPQEQGRCQGFTLGLTTDYKLGARGGSLMIMVHLHVKKKKWLC